MPATNATTHPTAARLAAVALTALALSAGPELAAAASSPPITQQAASANAAFLAYAPPPPGGAGALCLVDTGVNAIPDITPGLALATATDGGTGNDVDPLGHGTIDAAIAGGAGHGVLGAWPQLKIISIRATTVPSPGQEPAFEFDDYTRGISACNLPRAGLPPIYAIDLPLSSVIQPSPDQTANFADAVTQSTTRGITVVAAAGNNPGPIQLPASETGVFAVGAGETAGAQVSDDSPNQLCAFSATAGLTFFAPGCGVDQIDPKTDAPFCCGRGTSQASAFTAAVLVALRSYAPTLTAPQAAQLLLSTTVNGHLDVAAAFRAAGLTSIVDAGNAAVPKPLPPTPPTTSTPPVSTPKTTPTPGLTVGLPLVRTATWRHGVLHIVLASIGVGERLHVKVTFAGHKARFYATTRRTFRRHVPRPQRAVLHLTRATSIGATVTVKL